MAHPQRSLVNALRLSSGPGGSVHSRPLAEETIRMLNERAKLPKTQIGLEQRKIVRFDAWTDPRIFKILQDNPNGKSLSTEARKLFCDLRPDISSTELRCAFELLTRLPLDRARRLAAGKEYKVRVRVKGQAKLLLDVSKDQLLGKVNAPKQPVRVLLPLLFTRMASHMHAIFKPHLSSGGLPPPKLDKLFAKFASGKLRIEEHGPQEWMNAEPDSAYFFALAEFCIQAAHCNAEPGPRWWISLGGLFAALQDVFCVFYHRTGGERRFSEYRDVFFNTKREISEDLLLKHVASVRRRCDTIEKLVDQVTWNAFWYFFDDVQPPTVVPQSTPLQPPRHPLRSFRRSSSTSRA